MPVLPCSLDEVLCIGHILLHGGLPKVRAVLENPEHIVNIEERVCSLLWLSRLGKEDDLHLERSRIGIGFFLVAIGRDPAPWPARSVAIASCHPIRAFNTPEAAGLRRCVGVSFETFRV